MSNNAHILVVRTVTWVVLSVTHTTQAALLGQHQVLGVRAHSINDASLPSHWTLYMKEKSDAELAAATAPWNPSWRHTTLASFISQSVPQTSPQVPLKNTSTRPWDVILPQPTNLTVLKTTNRIKLWLYENHIMWTAEWRIIWRKIIAVIYAAFAVAREKSSGYLPFIGTQAPQCGVCVKSSEDSTLRCNTTPTNQSNCIKKRGGGESVILKIPREKLSGSLRLFTIHRNRRDSKARLT